MPTSGEPSDDRSTARPRERRGSVGLAVFILFTPTPSQHRRMFDPTATDAYQAGDGELNTEISEIQDGDEPNNLRQTMLGRYDCHPIGPNTVRRRCAGSGPAPSRARRAVGARDYVMPDVARIGGITGWMQATGIMAASDIESSSHLMPEISAQLPCATPGAHRLEYVDWADAFVEEPMRIEDGLAIPSDRLGTGLTWDEKRLKHLDTL